MITDLMPAFASIDDIIVDAPCYLRRDRLSWNGFDVPYMTREQVDRVMADLDRAAASNPDGLCLLRWEGDVLVEMDDAYEGDFPRDEPISVMLDGVLTKMWCPGGFSWTWSARYADEQA